MFGCIAKGSKVVPQSAPFLYFFPSNDLDGLRPKLRISARVNASKTQSHVAVARSAIDHELHQQRDQARDDQRTAHMRSRLSQALRRIAKPNLR